MSTNLLATKLHRPAPPPHLVARPHLIQLLNEGLHSGCQLTLISAPAGFGKSTCASQWLEHLDRPTAWLSLDSADNDPIRFLAYMVAALQKVDPSIGREVESIVHAGQPVPLEPLVAILLNNLQNSGQKLCLALDDFQVINENSILKALEMLLANQPANLHLVLVTRADPQLPLARLRANHRLSEIRAADLRFTTGEAERFLNDLMGLALSQVDVAALEERTEGWAAGLQLAALSMRDRADRSDFIAHLSGSHRYILSYLTEEVLRRQPEATQTFLLQTSILDKLSGELCDAVVSRRGGQGLLEQLFTANLFLIPMDDEGRWFRYHHLFADLLQSRLGQESTPEAITGLHRRAAAWFEAHGLAGEAVDHSLAAKDFEGAARLIEQQADSMLARGELVTLLRWIEVLPAEFARQHPLILVAKAWTLTLAGAVRQVEPELRAAEAQVVPGGETPETQKLRGNAAAIRAFFAVLAGEYPRALELAERAEALLPEDSVNARALLPYSIGAAYRAQGNYEKALDAFTRVARMGEAYDNLFTWATGVTEIANIYRYQGKLGAAAETCHAALQWMKERGVDRFGSLAKVEVPLVEVLRELDQIGEAYSRVNDVIVRMRDWAMPTDRIFVYLALIHIQHSQRDFDGVAASLKTALELKASHPVLIALASAVDICEIRYYLDCGDIATAENLTERYASQPGINQIYNLYEQGLIMLARVRIAQGRLEEAGSILSALAEHPSAVLRIGTLAEILALKARVLAAQGTRKTGLDCLLEALAIAEPEGFVRTFIDEGPELSALLREAATLAAGSPPLKAYITRLLAAFPPGPARPETASSRAETALLQEPLTEREMEVLRLIAEGLKYEEIAGRLFISLNTVRTYVKGIYGKLGVNNRSQAAAQAHLYKLI